jgi:hypothetical protein
MQRSLFLTILDRVCAFDNYFVQKWVAFHCLGFTPHQKITSTLHMLYYGLCGDATDEYYKISKSTAMESLKRFCMAVRIEFEGYHLRQPTWVDF